MAAQGARALALGPARRADEGRASRRRRSGRSACDADAASRFAAPRIASRNLHGTGCTLSSAIAAQVALGEPLSAAVGAAKAFVRTAIAQGKDFRLGKGPGPLLQFKTR